MQFFAGPIGASVYEAGEPLLRAYPEAQSKVHSSDPAVRIPRVRVQVSRKPENPDADIIQPKPYFCIELLFL